MQGVHIFSWSISTKDRIHLQYENIVVKSEKSVKKPVLVGIPMRKVGIFHELDLMDNKKGKDDS